MWRVICLGPGPQDRPRRVADRGPLLDSEARAQSLAQQLRATGLYERVKVLHVNGAVAAAGPEPLRRRAEAGVEAPTDNDRK